jgi:hypothetical protein
MANQRSEGERVVAGIRLATPARPQESRESLAEAALQVAGAVLDTLTANGPMRRDRVKSWLAEVRAARSVVDPKMINGEVALLAPCAADCYSASSLGDALAHSQAAALYQRYCQTCGQREARAPSDSALFRGALATHPPSQDVEVLLEALVSNPSGQRRVTGGEET